MRGSLRRVALLASRSSQSGSVDVCPTTVTGWTASTGLPTAPCASCGASGSSCLPTSSSTAWQSAQLQVFRFLAMASRHHQKDPHTKEARGVETPHIRSDPYNTPPRNFVQLLVHIKNARSITYLEKLLGSYEKQFDAVHCSAAITRLPRLVRRSTEREVLVPQSLLGRGRTALSKLQDMLWGHIPSLYPRQISNIIWALGQMKHLRNKESFELVRELLQVLQDRQYTRLFMHSNQLDAANLCSGLGQLQYRDPRFMDRLGQLIKRRIAQFHVRQVSQVAWGYSKLRVHNPELMNVLGDQAAENVHYYCPQGLSNTLWAFGNLRHKHDRLLNAAVEAADVQMDRFKTQDLAVTAWVLGRFGHHNEELMNKLEQRAVKCLDRFTPLGLTMLLRAFAKLDHPCPALMDAVAKGVAKEQHVRTEANHLCGLIWAYAKLKHKNEHSEKLFYKLSEVSVQLMRFMSPYQVQTVLNSTNELGYLEPEVTQAAAQHVLNNCTKLWKLEDTTATVSLLQQVGFNNPGFLAQLASDLVDSPEAISPDPNSVGDLLLLYVKSLESASPASSTAMSAVASQHNSNRQDEPTEGRRDDIDVSKNLQGVDSESEGKFQVRDWFKRLVEASVKVLSDKVQAEKAQACTSVSASGSAESSWNSPPAGVNTTGEEGLRASAGLSQEAAEDVRGAAGTQVAEKLREAVPGKGGRRKRSRESAQEVDGQPVARVADMKHQTWAALFYCCAKAGVELPAELLAAAGEKLAGMDATLIGARTVAFMTQGLAVVDGAKLEGFPFGPLWEAAEIRVKDLTMSNERLAIVEAMKKLPRAPTALVDKLEQAS